MENDTLLMRTNTVLLDLDPFCLVLDRGPGRDMRFLDCCSSCVESLGESWFLDCHSSCMESRGESLVDWVRDCPVSLCQAHETRCSRVPRP